MKTKTHLIFIKTTGHLTASSTDDAFISTIDKTKFDVKTVDMDLNDGEYWHGNYSTGEIKNRNEKPLVRQSIVKYNFNVKILEEYPLHKQLGIIIDALASSNMTLTPEFEEMKSFIDTMKENYSTALDRYKNSDAYTFVSEDDDKEHAASVRQFLTT